MIKNIIFDFGGVLLDLDYEKTFAELTEVMGVKMSFDEIPAQIFKVMLGYEKGEINTETFLWNLQKESTKLTPHPDKLINAWNAMLLGWNADRFEFLLSLQEEGYRVFLLSNTNELHLEWVYRDLKNTHKINNFDTRFFDGTFYSHKMHLRKPEIGIYDRVIAEAELDPTESLFIDDNSDNISAAKLAGLHAVLHDPKTEIIEQLPVYLKQLK